MISIKESETIANWIQVSKNIFHLYQKIQKEGRQPKTIDWLLITRDYEEKLIDSLPKKKERLMSVLKWFYNSFYIEDITLENLVLTTHEIKNAPIIRIIRQITHLIHKLEPDFNQNKYDLANRHYLIYANFLEQYSDSRIPAKTEFYRLLYLERDVEGFLLPNNLKSIPNANIDLNLYVRHGHEYYRKNIKEFETEAFNEFLLEINDLYNQFEISKYFTERSIYILSKLNYLKSLVYIMGKSNEIIVMEGLQKTLESDKKAGRKRQARFLEYFLNDVIKTGKQILLDEIGITRKK